MITRLAAAFRYFWTGEQPPVGDGRPMTTDEFLGRLLKEDDLDHYDREEAINDWLHGDWNGAMCYLDEDEPTMTEEPPPAPRAFYADRPKPGDDK